MLFQIFVIAAIFSCLASSSSFANTSSIWVTEVPTFVRPYAIQHQSAVGYIIGQQTYRFPVTGPSSDYAFTLISTNAPESTDLGVFPHTHQIHYENFFSFRGRTQLWTDKSGEENTRVLIPGDFGAVPHNTTHTFQFLDPDSELVGIIQPGGFEDLFYFLASSNYTSPTLTPYDPSTNAFSMPPPDPTFLQLLENFDVYAQNYTPRSDAIDGKAPSNTTWHDGPNPLAADPSTPYYIAKDYGPKYINNLTGSYQIIQPLVTPLQSDGNFTLSTITIARVGLTSVDNLSFPSHAAFKVLDGQLMVMIGDETVALLQGDVVFVPGETRFRYWSDVAYTKFLCVSQGAVGLDRVLIEGGRSWGSPVWPVE